MIDPFFYLKFMFIVGALVLLLYLIFSGDSVVTKVVRTLLSVAVMTWQACILIANNQV